MTQPLDFSKRNLDRRLKVLKSLEEIMRRHHPGFYFLVQSKISLPKYEEIPAPTPVSQLVVAGHQTPSPSSALSNE